MSETPKTDALMSILNNGLAYGAAKMANVKNAMESMETSLYESFDLRGSLAKQLNEANAKIAELEEYAKYAELPNAQQIAGAIWEPTAANMPLRDWIAGMALHGYLAGRNGPSCNPTSYQTGDLTKTCYGYADAMLAARKECA